MGVENLVSTGIRSPDRPASSESLYRLSYPGSQQVLSLKLIYTKCQSHSPRKTYCVHFYNGGRTVAQVLGSSAGHRGRPASNQGQSVCDLWCTKWYCFCNNSLFPSSVSFYGRPIHIYSSITDPTLRWQLTASFK